MGDLVKLPIRSIRLDFQHEENLIQETVEEFITLIRGGHVFPPITVYFDGETYWLADGFHRVHAARRLRRRKIEAEIVPGTFAEMEAEFKRMQETWKLNNAQWAAEHRRKC